MTRIALSDGQWFDRKKASCFEESTYWNGNNYISKATGSQWNHEELYKTKKGKWILHSWSQWQGSTDSWDIISEAEAIAWLSVHQPETAQELNPELIQSLEI